MTRQGLAEIITIACRHRQRSLHPDMLKLAWAHKAAWKIQAILRLEGGPALVEAIREAIQSRDTELRAAEWYAQN